MTTTLRHQPTRAAAAIAISGRPGWAALHAPTDLDLAAAVRAYTWTTLPGRNRRRRRRP